VIEAYTINGAYVMEQEHLTGSLEVGKEADFVVIDRNPFAIKVDEIASIQVLKTILAGDVVYDHRD